LKNLENEAWVEGLGTWPVSRENASTGRRERLIALRVLVFPRPLAAKPPPPPGAAEG
jgi:hypothetical protein